MIWIILTFLLLAAGFLYFYIKIRAESVSLAKRGFNSSAEIKSRIAMLREMKKLAGSFEKPEGMSIETISLGGGRVEVRQTEIEPNEGSQPEIVSRLDQMVDNLSLEACSELSQHQKFFAEYSKSIAKLRSALKDASS